MALASKHLAVPRPRPRTPKPRGPAQWQGAGCRNFSRLSARGGAFSLDILFYRTKRAPTTYETLRVSDGAGGQLFQFLVADAGIVAIEIDRFDQSVGIEHPEKGLTAVFLIESDKPTTSVLTTLTGDSDRKTRIPSMNPLSLESTDTRNAIAGQPGSGTRKWNGVRGTLMYS
jgi:hypothetical protein